MQRVAMATQLAKSCIAPRGAACVHYGATSSDVEALFHENLVRMMHIAVIFVIDDGAGSGVL
jgi:adenylosuccinate lyase